MIVSFMVAILAGSVVLPGESATAQKQAASVPAAKVSEPAVLSRSAQEEKALLDVQRSKLAEKEAMLAAKEQELKKLSAKLETQLKSLEESKKRLDDTMKAKSVAEKKEQEEKLVKMVKLFKTMKGEQAGKLIDNLKENQALLLLGRLDTKSVAKLVPFINQPRILRWISDNIQL